VGGLAKSGVRYAPFLGMRRRADPWPFIGHRGALVDGQTHDTHKRGDEPAHTHYQVFIQSLLPKYAIHQLASCQLAVLVH
jgi:hypothetical protein